MVFGYFTLVIALIISGIAAYYSIVGLATLFAAALVPVIIMGAALEIGKITAAVWLKLNWTRASLTYKLYLVPAVIVLMFLTSMGIFGFLSKAHLDQTASGTESQAQIERLNSEISRRSDIVKRAEVKIKELESTGTGQDAQIQSQIDREQARIDSVMKRIEPAIKEQNDIIGAQVKLYQDQLEKIDNDLQRLQSNLDRNDIATAQSQVGVQPDGRIGPRTQAAFKEYRERLATQRQELISNIEKSNNNPNIQNARKEILRLRSTVETQVNESNQLINRLRTQIGKGPTTNIDSLIDEQQARIRSANTELEQFIEQKYKLETEYRKLEAEVGPVKYLAQLIYGDNPDKSLLENAVRIVILIIVAVFDPLALVLILAAQQSIRWARETPVDKFHPSVKTDISLDEKQFNINDHLYLFKPWKHAGKLDPLVSQVENKKHICNHCSNELLSIHPNGLFCSNTSCTSYSYFNIFEHLNSNTIKANSSQTISDLTESDLHAEKPLQARRSFKASTIKVPETLDVRKKLKPQADNAVSKNIKNGFGISFPNNPNQYDTFLRVDYNPSKYFRYENNKWIEINKTPTDFYVFDSAYVEFLIDKVQKGEYKIENLTDQEREQLVDFLEQQSKTNE